MEFGSGIIRKLPDDVIRKIAAGEVISRPSAAIKELIENSIDAGSTLIKLELSANPLDYGQVEDNGKGITYDDMLVVCKRFTTSKTYKSIFGVKTLGFRGEALASLSQTSRVTITSRTKDDSKRTKVPYENSEPIMDYISEEDGPVGFTIKYENMFYNLRTRYLSLMPRASVEFNLCLDLLQKYSIHFPDIDFIFHKLGNLSYEFTTCNNPRINDDVSDYDYEFFNRQNYFPPELEISMELEEYKENVDDMSMRYLNKVKNSIKNMYGLSVSNVLYPFISNSFNEIFYNCKGLFSHPNESCRSKTFIIFINNRLVDMPTLRLVLNR